MSTDKPGAPRQAIFDINAIIERFPATADTMMCDTRMTDETEASCRVFRVYKPVPAHFHATCDEYLYVLRGRGTFAMGDLAPFPVEAGQLLFFKKGTIHSLEATEDPFVFLAIDTPRRDPSDVNFVNPADGTPSTFMGTKTLY
jgi:mannose-6-phosphate isomerase-like protein (cupin superfamily)